MIAIETKYLGPTNTRGSRYVAYTCNGHRLSMSIENDKDATQNPGIVARALADKMGWKGQLIGGGTKAGMAWVFDDSMDKA
jgi:hypothetical protein